MDPELLDLIARLAELNDDELADLNTRLLALFDETRDAEVVNLELLTELTGHIESIRVEDDRRQTEATEAAAEIARLNELVHPPAASDDAGDGEDGSDDADEGDSTDGEDGDPADSNTDDATADADQPREAVAAAATSARPARTPLSQLSARRPAAAAPEAPDGRIAQVITAGANATGRSAGQSLADAHEIAEVLSESLSSMVTSKLTPGQKFHVARIRTPYPEERQLSPDDAGTNERRIQAVVASAREGARRAHDGHGAEALVAAGGLCAPVAVRYELETVGDDYRPVRDALVSFDGSRGGVRFMTSPTLSEVDTDGTDAAVSQWTHDQDLAALTDTGVRKPVFRIDCGDEVTEYTYAVPARVRIGNVLARTNPERVGAVTRLVGVAHSRFAEQLLLARMKTLSTQTMEENSPILGSTRDFKQALVKAAWATRSRNRMTESEPLRVIAPDALVAHVAIDLSRELPGAPTERLTVQASQMLRDIGNAEGVTVSFTPDMPTHVAPAQAAAAQLVDLPSPIEWVIFPEGTFGFLDGGSLDLGFAAGTPIRDSDLNAANDYELFMENWEGVAKFGGVQSLWNRSYLCPTGTTSGTDVVDCGEAS